MSYRIKPTLKPIKSVSKVSESWLSRKTGLHPERIQLFWALAMAAFSMIFLAYATHKYFEVFEYDSPAGYMEITPKEFYGPRIPESILKKLKSEVIPQKVYAKEYVARNDIEQKILNKFGKDGQIMLAIAKCESGLNPKAIGDKHLNPHSYGLFQIRGFKSRPPVDVLMTVDGNIDAGYKLYDAGTGLRHWSCYTNKSYLKYLVNK